ncbi:SLBB domain-containing protein [Mucilaginibacter sp.]|uniref:SLBB domain-containing protein n=1 Tax=Mucilaginibacter sp. TaxID=1882438 RepID=UPI00283C7746|nr:SLBB domain-containing protein [Mucilaginibacter sp.]MDR3694916.1 SLBB domain-containing protein [Mucilaginibacter sp.]
MKYLKSIAFSLLFIVNFIVSQPLLAQTMPQNLSNVNVNELSDGQIRQLMQQAQSAGLNDQQLLQEAANRGMPQEQIQNLQKRILILRKSNNNAANSSDTLSSQARRLNYKPDTIPDTLNNLKNRADILNTLQPKIFGADLFRNKNLTFEPNLSLATPINYILGPNDQLNINVYGNSVVNWKLSVSPEGNINIPGIGLLNVSGKTIEIATLIIRNKLIAANYAIGRGTNVQVTLGNIRSIKVIIVGEVVKPGTYTLPSLATVFNALYAAGGPGDNGSFRQIEVIRNNHIIRRLDIYDFLLKGEQKDNIRLEDQDIISIPTYRIRVEMTGEVKRPGLFEVLPGETLKDIIGFAGGFTDQAYTDLIKVSQISEQQRRLTDVPEADFSNYIPLRGDKYTVEHILNRYENRVTIKGAVFRPGEYELEKGLTVSRLIQKAAGLKEDAFTGRVGITRLKSDNTIEQLSFNLGDIINKSAVDIPLQREDIINVSSLFDLRGKYKVSIKGEIRKPGDFIYADSMKVADLIIKAGGFTEGASPKRIEVSRRVFDSDPKVKNSRIAQVYSVNVGADLKADDANFTLKPFDNVSVYSLPGFEIQKTVKVEGEVVYPGYYTIEKKDEKISDIIARAGGLTVFADIEGSSLKRDNTAILGIDKTKNDSTTLTLNKERAERMKRLQRSYMDSTKTDTTQFRNNYIGINLKKILDNPGKGDDLIVEDNDVLRIPKQQQVVRVNGEVLYPSAVVYTSGKTFKDYVLNAGGFSPVALKSGAYVVYPNGTVNGTRKFLFFNNHPKVKPGSEIYVPRKPVTKGTSLQDILGFTTGLVSLVVLFITIKKL